MARHDYPIQRLLVSGITVVLCFSFNSLAAQTAQARLFCLSVRFQQGVYHGLLGDITLDLSTIGSAANGELAPSFGAPDHYSSYLLYDTFSQQAIAGGRIDLNTPAFVDANGNGFDDFFEVREAGSGVSTGSYTSPVDTGPVHATWSRAAGSKDGTYALEFGSGQTSLGTYQGMFEILEYAGPLNYRTDSNKVSGAVRLLQSGAPNNRLTGPIEFTRSPTNRFDVLTLWHEVWTNASLQALKVSNDVDSFQRNRDLKTNYFGFVDFEDGDPNTTELDYLTWFLTIDDVNDSNGNGIPDFTDDVIPATRAPELALTKGATNFLLSVSGTVGARHEIQSADSLSAPLWAPILVFTLTNNPHLLSLPAEFGQGASQFLRAVGD